MKKLFAGYYRPNKETLADIWRECLFVLDTNVLLGLYRYPKEAHDDLLRTFGQISDRLWIPHQVAIEYNENRLSVIAEQLNKFDEVSNIISDAQRTLVNKLNDLQLRKRHSVINPENFLTKVESAFKEFESELEELKEKQPDVSDEDKTLEDIDSLFDGKIGEPLSSEELKKLYLEGKDRYEQHRPPGYLDKGKSKQDEQFYFFGDLSIQREFGDLIIWYQLLKEAKAKDSKYIIFVTDDDKEDWWWIYRGKIIGPRPELIDEITQKANVSAFYMYNSARFLRYAKEFLGAEIGQETIEQVREISQLQEPRTVKVPSIVARAQYDQIERFVLDWLKSRYPSVDVNVRGFPDFVVDENGKKLGFEVKFVRDPRHLFIRWKDLAYRGFYEVSQKNLDTFYMVFVVEHRKNSDTEIKRWVRSYDFPENVKMILMESYISESGSVVDLHYLGEY